MSWTGHKLIPCLPNVIVKDEQEDKFMIQMLGSWTKDPMRATRFDNNGVQALKLALDLSVKCGDINRYQAYLFYPSTINGKPLILRPFRQGQSKLDRRTVEAYS